MPWGKMDDKFHRHAKTRALMREKGGREALGVWTLWWSWCLDDAALDGVVPTDVLPAADMRAAVLLVKHRLWDEVDGGYRFHNFEKWNPSRDKVDAKREADRVNVAAKREATRATVARDKPPKSDASREDVASDTDTDSARHEQRQEVASLPRARGHASPSPSHPLPNPTPPSKGVREWGFKALVEVISDRREAAGGGPYEHTLGDYSKIETAVEFFRKLDPDSPADAAAYAFDEWAKTKWATEATWPVSAWLKDPGKHFRHAKESA